MFYLYSNKFAALENVYTLLFIKQSYSGICRSKQIKKLRKKLDILLKDKEERSCLLIDMSVSIARNTCLKTNFLESSTRSWDIISLDPKTIDSMPSSSRRIFVCLYTNGSSAAILTVTT